VLRGSLEDPKDSWSSESFMVLLPVIYSLNKEIGSTLETFFDISSWFVKRELNLFRRLK